MDEVKRAALERWLAGAAGAERVTVRDVVMLSGGAIQQNWRIDLEIAGGPQAGAHSLVLRTDSPSSLSVSHGRTQEYALFRAAHAAGVTVPEPLWVCPDNSVLGKPFFLMRRIEGVTQGFRVVKDQSLGGGPERLAESLGRELARIHTIRPPREDLAFLAGPGDSKPAEHLVAVLRAKLDASMLPRPALEWGLRWLERNAPARGDIVLSHNDFRTGNYMVTAEGVTGILDWEFAAWGDPHEDIGWFCARCWRFGATGREAGGIGPREAFYRGYEAESGREIDRARVPYWEVMATMRWAVIAIAQAERHISGAEHNIELALTGHIVPELELDILQSIERIG